MCLTRCPLVNPPPQAFGGIRKNGLFFTFLKFFHFYPKVKENKICKKKTQKNAQKIAIFSFSRRCFIFKFFIFYIKFQLEKMKKKFKKISKKSHIFTFSRVEMWCKKWKIWKWNTFSRNWKLRFCVHFFAFFLQKKILFSLTFG